MIEYQLTLKHWLGLGFITIAIVIASIRPLEFEAYILHQLGTIFMLAALLFTQKKNWPEFLQFCALSYFFTDSYCGSTLPIFLCAL